MYIIPTPKRITESKEVLKKRSVKPMKAVVDERLLKSIDKLPAEESGIPLYVIYNDTKEEGYRLSVSNEEIKIEGDGVNGAFYAVQTLRQIFANDEIYCV